MSLTINGVNTNKISLAQKEGKDLSFAFNVPINTATFDLVIKDLSNTTQVTKIDADFDKTLLSSRIVKINLNTSDLDLDTGFYNIQLKTTWNSSTSVDKTIIIKLEITESLF